MNEHAKDPEAVFLAALEKATPEERAAHLEEACAGNPELLQRVHELLGCHDQSRGPLDAPPPGLARTMDDAPNRERVDTQIGPYKLLEQIGEGGFGVVFMAEQQEPVRRKVALKVLKPGMDTKQVVARFEAERQALAIMDHPNIAKVFDGGATPSGRPYFVMELVKGVPITEFCDQNHMTPRQRLELFIYVCHAVQHAHHKGIVHRDLKPSNVLVSVHDTTPVVKVIDFGVAKALGQELTDNTLFTGFAQMIGTPLYMSPEQAGQSGLDIDTRSDIYSLGVLLYELLTGTTPFDKDRFKHATYEEIRRIIRDEEPPRPSTRLSDSKDSLPSISAQRHTEPTKLTRLVRGELDWIVMKALEKDRNRRYETANAFAADVQRYLADEPVLAGRPAATYRFKKFLRRNRGPVIAASLVLFALVGGIVGTTWGLVYAVQAGKRETARAAGEELAKLDAEKAWKEEAKRADGERKARSAERDRAEGERQAKLTAQKRLEQRERGIVLLGSILRGMDPNAEEKDGKELRVLLGGRLDQATMDLEDEAIGDALAVAELQLTLGECHLGLGNAEKAILLLTKARATFTTRLGLDNARTFICMNNLAIAYQHAGKLNLAMPLFEETLKLRMAKFGADHHDTLQSMGNLAEGYLTAGELDKALPLLKETFERAKAKLGPDDPATLTDMSNLASGYKAAGKLELALPLWEESLELKKVKLGPFHRSTLNTMNSLATGYHSAWKLDLALPLYEETLKLRRAKLGRDHPDTLTSMNNLAGGYLDVDKLDLAVPLYEETIKLLNDRLGLDHPHTLSGMDNMMECYQVAGKLDLALPLFEETLKLTRAKLGDNHPNTLTSMTSLAKGYEAVGKFDLALPLFEEAFKLRKSSLGPVHPHTLYSMHNLAEGYRAAGKLDLALPLLEDTLKLRKSKLGQDHPSTLVTMNCLAEGYREARKFDLSLPLHEETLKLRRAKYGPDHPAPLQSMNNLGVAYAYAGKLDLALPLFKETLQRSKANLGPNHPETLMAINNLASGHKAAGELDVALRLFEQTLKLRKVKLGFDHPDTLTTMNALADCYRAANKLELALPLYEEAVKLRKAKLGVDHAGTLNSMHNLAGTYRDTGKLNLALPLYVETLKHRKATLGPNDASTLLTMHNLATVCWRMKKLDQSIPLLEELLSLRRRKLGDEHYDTLRTAANLGVNYRDDGRPAQAIPLLQEAFQQRHKHSNLAWVRDELLSAYTLAGRTTEGAALLRDELASARKRVKPDSKQLGDVLAVTGLHLLNLKAFADAEPILRESLTIRAKQEPNALSTFVTKSLLGGALLGQKKYADAEPLLLQGYQGMKQREASIPEAAKSVLVDGLERLAQCYEAVGPKDKAEEWRKKFEAVKIADKLWQDLLAGKDSKYRFVETKHGGSLTARAAQQVHLVDVKAGMTYVIDMESKAFDTFLRMEIREGTPLAENDDVTETNLNSRIIFTAPTTGTYRILATAYAAGATGPYVVRIRELVESK